MTKKLNKKFFSEAGKLGKENRWPERYKILKALSGHFDKQQNNNFLTWPTKHLKTLWDYVGKNKNV